jgi:peptidoglycan-associated lipoprotein
MMKNITLYCALALLAAACASNKPEAEVTTPSGGTKTPSTGTASSGSTTTPNTSANVSGDPLHDPNNVLSKRSVYFDFDSNVVKDEYRGLIQAHSRYMTEHRDSRARIEGNCDERGSREYNLALGQRRAEAVKKIMTVLGVSDGRIETVSFGEEKPQAQGHDEAAWAKNRRDDIKYAGE